MITKEQEIWLSRLDDTNSIEIFPYDTEAGAKFQRIKRLLRSVIGEELDIVHRGASNLGISGQKEIDIYIPVDAEIFNSLISPLESVFGKPRSHYPLERVCFVSTVDGTKTEIFVINNKSKGWLDGVMFENHLQENKEALDAYRILKEEGHGLSTQAYYRKKIEFINNIVSK